MKILIKVCTSALEAPVKLLVCVLVKKALLIRSENIYLRVFCYADGLKYCVHEKKSTMTLLWFIDLYCGITMLFWAL